MRLALRLAPLLAAAVAEYTDGEIGDSLIGRADAKLYDANSAGRNCVEM